MYHHTVAAAGRNAAGVPCRLYSLVPYSPATCRRPVEYVVDEWDLDENPRRHVRQFGVCADHADHYR